MIEVKSQHQPTVRSWKKNKTCVYRIHSLGDGHQQALVYELDHILKNEIDEQWWTHGFREKQSRKPQQKSWYIIYLYIYTHKIDYFPGDFPGSPNPTIWPWHSLDFTGARIGTARPDRPPDELPLLRASPDRRWVMTVYQSLHRYYCNDDSSYECNWLIQ